jgi:hypothetical protein
MQLVFALIIMLNGEEQNDRVSYWEDVNRCRYFSHRINKQAYNYYYGHSKSPVRAYCIPIWVDPKNTEVLR